jgi:hypothetical protein
MQNIFNIKVYQNDKYKVLDNSILRLTDNTYIPMVEDNSDYIRYQAWLADGGEPAIEEPRVFSYSPSASCSAIKLRRVINKLDLRTKLVKALELSKDTNLKDTFEFETTFSSEDTNVQELFKLINITDDALVSLLQEASEL